MNEPIVFEPIFQERVWGGHLLQAAFGKSLPEGVQVGEAWEIVDRPEAQSVVRAGKYRGATLHQLWTAHRREIFGAGYDAPPRFPLLIKLLDCRERLSLQVHPPARGASSLAGEPKTEMWHVLRAEKDAEIFSGLKPGVTREQFARALADGSVANLVQCAVPQTGDTFFIPSGRVHAIGGGNLICEIQQNSDTTFRVFDWNRLGTDGLPRALHAEQSLASIDFADAETGLVQQVGETLVSCEFFKVERWEIEGRRPVGTESQCAVFVGIAGEVECGSLRFGAGDCFLVPAGSAAELSGRGRVLRARLA